MTQVTPIRDLKGYLEPEQVERLIGVASNPRDALLVRIPWRTGIRVSELIGIRVQDIDFENRAIVIKIQKMRKRDGKAIERRRVVPIDQGTLDMVKEYLGWRKQFPYKGELLFPITRQRVDQIYWKLGRRAGITKVGDPAVSKHTKLHPHILRHSFSIHCVKHGMTIERLQKFWGTQVPQPHRSTCNFPRKTSMTNMTRFGKKRMKERRPRIKKARREPGRRPRITLPWGRGASEFRPGIFTKRYLQEHGEGCAADVFRALKDDLRRINRERVEIGDRPIRGCTYNSYAKYWHWFKLLGLVEPTDKLELSIYGFLEKRKFYRLTDRGLAEVQGWQDPVRTLHPTS